MLSKQEFQLWLEDPTTRDVLKYLEDFSAAMEEVVAYAIAQGHVISEEDQRLHFAKKEMVDDLINLNHEDIEDFYASQASRQ